MGGHGGSSKRSSSMSGGFEPCYIDGLDAALLTAVLQHLPAPHLARAGCVCRAWATAASNEHLWMAQFDALCTPDYRRNCLPQLSSMVAGKSRPLPSVRHQAWRYMHFCTAQLPQQPQVQPAARQSHPVVRLGSLHAKPALLLAGAHVSPLGMPLCCPISCTASGSITNGPRGWSRC